MGLTKRQAEVLDYIRRHQEKYGLVPTVREICAHFGLKGPAGIHRILHVLIDKGFLRTTPGKNRSWRLSSGLAVKTMPLLGRIAAGSPILAVAHHDAVLPLAPMLFGDADCFALRVKGDSMIKAHIMDRDLAVIRPQNDAQNGDIVAVLVEGMFYEATLKVFYKTRFATELRPANSTYEPIVFGGP